MKLLEALEDAGYITSTNVRMLAIYAEKWSVSTYEALLETHIMAEHNLADAIAEVFKLDRLYSFDASDVDAEAVGMIAWSEAQEYNCFIPYRDDDGTFQVCVLDPLDEKVLQFLGQRLPRFRPVIMDKRMMCRSIEEAYPLERQIPTLLQLP
jgi:uncharacterized protein YbaR (Trm112 family)